MFVKFLIVATAIFIGGPIENEGGKEAIQAKGLKPALETAIEQGQPVDYSKLND